MTNKKTASSSESRQAGDRLQKVLALAGYGSRRQCEELITTGRVEVDRKVINELGARVDTNQQEVRVDGEVVKMPRKKYFLLHKPVGVISTSRDPAARIRVIDLIEDSSRLFTVGRLDKASSGLILVTNDGDLAQQLTHPKYGIEKVYRATVVGKPTPEAMRQLRQGLYLAEGKTNVERVTLLKAHPTKSQLEIVLKEGRNREIRRILARVGHKVVQLKRIAIGPLRLGELPLGAFRELTRGEVQELERAARRPNKETRAESDSPASPKRRSPSSSASTSTATPKRRPAASKKPAIGATRRDARRPAATVRTSRRAAKVSAYRPRGATVIGSEEAWEPDSVAGEEQTAPTTARPAGRPRRDGAGGRSSRSASTARDKAKPRPRRSDESSEREGYRERRTSGRARPAGSTDRPPKKKGRRPIIQRRKKS